MNLLKNLALILFVTAFVACSSDDNSDEGNFPSESEIPTSEDDINPETSGEEDGIQEGSFSIVGRWELTGEEVDGEFVALGEDECADIVVFDNKGVMSTEFDFDGTTCVEEEVGFGAFVRDGNTLSLNFEGDKVVYTIEVTENTLKVYGTEDGEAWVDVFVKQS